MPSLVRSVRFGYAYDDWLNTNADNNRFGCLFKAWSVQDKGSNGFGSRTDLIGSGNPIRTEPAPLNRSVYFNLLSHSLFRPEPTFSFLSIFRRCAIRADPLSFSFLFWSSVFYPNRLQLVTALLFFFFFPPYSQTSPFYHQSYL